MYLTNLKDKQESLICMKSQKFHMDQCIFFFIIHYDHISRNVNFVIYLCSL